MSIRIRENSYGEYVAALSSDDNDLDALEGMGETISEALYDLAELLAGKGC